MEWLKDTPSGIVKKECALLPKLPEWKRYAPWICIQALCLVCKAKYLLQLEYHHLGSTIGGNHSRCKTILVYHRKCNNISCRKGNHCIEETTRPRRRQIGTARQVAAGENGSSIDNEIGCQTIRSSAGSAYVCAKEINTGRWGSEGSTIEYRTTRSYIVERN